MLAPYSSSGDGNHLTSISSSEPLEVHHRLIGAHLVAKGSFRTEVTSGVESGTGLTWWVKPLVTGVYAA